MKLVESNLKKGMVIEGRFELTYPISYPGAFRAKESNGRAVRIEVIESTDVPESAVTGRGQLLFAERLSGLDHRSLGRLRESSACEVDGADYFLSVFELVGSETIADRIERDGPFAPFKATSIICDLLDGLNVLHNNSDPLVHNGISPRSVSLDYSNGIELPVLYGFENLRSIHDKRESILRSRLSVFHSAPELKDGIFMPLSDIFSVGALLYQMIWGVPPWFSERLAALPADEAFKLIKSKRRNLHPPPSGFAVPQEIFSIIRIALNLDPGRRFRSVDDFQNALSLEFATVGDEQKRSPRDVVEPADGKGFNAIAGMQDLKDKLRDEVIRPIHERERFKEFGIPLVNGILLYGPPGCGKTFIAERLAEEIGYDFLMIKPSDLGSPYVHGGQLKIGELFKSAEEQAPCMVFVDEIDAILPSRDSSDLNHSYAAEVNEFLAQFSNCGERGVFVLAATNKPERMDIAALRSGRMDKIINIPPPDLELREAMFRIHLASRPAASDIDFAQLASRTDKYVSADIFKLVVEAARKAERSDTAITQGFLLEAIEENPPSIPASELERYEQLIEEWEGQRTEPSRRIKIGFVQPQNKEH